MEPGPGRQTQSPPLPVAGSLGSFPTQIGLGRLVLIQDRPANWSPTLLEIDGRPALLLGIPHDALTMPSVCH